jgi:hypothetical protein
MEMAASFQQWMMVQPSLRQRFVGYGGRNDEDLEDATAEAGGENSLSDPNTASAAASAMRLAEAFAAVGPPLPQLPQQQVVDVLAAEAQSRAVARQSQVAFGVARQRRVGGSAPFETANAEEAELAAVVGGVAAAALPLPDLQA